MKQMFKRGRLLRIAGIAMFAVVLTLLAGCKTVYMKGTPLYTGEYSQKQGPPEDRINIWPLMYYHDPALSVAWPVGEKTDDHVAVRPVFSVYKLDKKEHEYNVLWPLTEFDFDTDDHRIMPFFWGGTSKHDRYFVAFPEVWWYDDCKAVLPFFWGGRNEHDKYFVAFPEVWWYDDFKAVLPFAWWDDGFTAFPLVWYEKDEFCHFFPFWAHFKYGEKHHDTYVMGPIFNRRNKPHEQGHAVWPLYGNYRKGDNETYKYGLWPLCHDYRNKSVGESTQVAAPLYFRHKYGSDEWKVIPFLLYQERHGSRQMTLSPVWCAGKSGEAEWQAMLPLYYYSNDPEKKTSRLLTPLVGKTTSPKGSRWFVLPLASSVAWGDKEKDLWFLAPLSRFRWGSTSVQNYIFPLYGYSSNEKLFLSPLISRQDKEDEGFVNFGGILAHYAREGNERKFYALPPFSQFKWGHGNMENYIFPLYSYNRNDKTILTPLVSLQNKEDEGFVNVGGCLAHYNRRSNDRRGFYLLPPLTGVEWKKGEGCTHARIAPLFSWSKYGERRSLWIAPWIYFSKHPNYGKSSCFPLWEYKRRKASTRDREGHNVDMNVLFWLYDYRRKVSSPKEQKPGEDHDYVRSRLLWRIMHYERHDDHKTLDMFPFITYDRDKSEGFRKFSFAWRFIRYERRRDGNLDLDLFFLPICR